MTASTQPKNRTLGNSGLSVLPIGLGCMSLSGAYGKSDDDEAIRVIHHAIDRGVNFLDSSDMYGWGHNEKLLGKALGAGATRSCWRPSSARRSSRAAPTASTAARPT